MSPRWDALTLCVTGFHVPNSGFELIIAKNELELILLPPPSKCQNNLALLCSTGDGPRTSRTLGKLFPTDPFPTHDISGIRLGLVSSALPLKALRTQVTI